MTTIPSVRYVQSRGLAIAHQIVSEGPQRPLYLLFETPTVVGN